MQTSSMCWTSTALLLLLAAAAVTCAQPCIECSNPTCTTQNCQSICKQSCAVAAPSPSPPTVDIGACQGFGRVAAAGVSQDACDATLAYCQGGAQALAARAQEVQVSLTQCENIAFGVCQSESMDSNKSPCGYAFGGYQQCSGQQFMDFYTAEVNERCEDKVRDIAP